ncbi:hypothetical protein [Nocardia sp. NPDC049707]|uniref:hypothetical protein n=1 Tax=Nocardia sp. NPDC049707 TaxID=3154735 RepID=UPI0034376E24
MVSRKVSNASQDDPVSFHGVHSDDLIATYNYGGTIQGVAEQRLEIPFLGGQDGWSGPPSVVVAHVTVRPDHGAAQH